MSMPSTNRKRIINISKEDKSNSKTNPDLAVKRLNICEKISTEFKNKHKKLFLQANYDKPKLLADLMKVIECFDLQKFDFSKFITFSEKEIIDNIYKRAAVEGRNLDKDSYFLIHLEGRIMANQPGNMNQIQDEEKELIRNLKESQRELLPQENIQLKVNRNMSPFDRKEKLENLKNIKEKDEWAYLAKKAYNNQLEENINKKLKIEQNKINLQDTLAHQIEEKKISSRNIIEKDIQYLSYVKDDYQHWQEREEQKKQVHKNKIMDMNEKRDDFIKNKHIEKEVENTVLQRKEKEIMDKMQQDNVRERSKFDKKKEAEKQLFNEQIALYQMKELHKKEYHTKELEAGRNCLQEFDKIMEKQENSRIDMKNQIKERARIQDLRQKLVVNVKEIDNYINQEVEKKYFKERNDIENRNKIINDFNYNKKKELITDMKQTLDQQKEDKIRKDKEKSKYDQEYDEKIKKNFNDFVKEKKEKENLKRSQIMKYKEELDNQLKEKERSRRPIMDEIERKMNRIGVIE